MFGLKTKAYKAKRERTKEKRHRMTVFGTIGLIFFILYILIMFFPIMWAIYTSFKTTHGFTLDPLWLPKDWTIENYIKAFENISFTSYKNGELSVTTLWRMYLNSFLYAFGTTLISAVCCCCVGYVTAVFDWKFSKFIYGLNLVIMIVPIVGSLPATLDLMRNLHLYDSILGLYVTSFSFTGMPYMLYYATFKQQSKGYMEAAKIDGASNLKIFLRIMFPLVFGIFFTMFLTGFIGKWNDYQTSMLYLPSYPTVAQGIYSYSFNSNGAIASVPMKLTGCMLLLLPVLVIFIVFHKRFLINMSTGGLKG